MSELKKNIIILTALIVFFTSMGTIFQALIPYPFFLGVFIAFATYPLWDIIETKIREKLK